MPKPSDEVSAEGLWMKHVDCARPVDKEFLADLSQFFLQTALGCVPECPEMTSFNRACFLCIIKMHVDIEQKAREMKA